MVSWGVFDGFRGRGDGRPDGAETYFVTRPSFMSVELICDLRSGSRVAAV